VKNSTAASFSGARQSILLREGTITSMKPSPTLLIGIGERGEVDHHEAPSPVSSLVAIERGWCTRREQHKIAPQVEIGLLLVNLFGLNSVPPRGPPHVQSHRKSLDSSIIGSVGQQEEWTRGHPKDRAHAPC
jgi:hypothetical protein